MNLNNLLENVQLKKTPVRLAILDLFQKNIKNTFSASEIVQLLSEHSDRVTIFRTLNTFEEKNILHKIIDYSGVSIYALTSEKNEDCTAHFFCTHCEKIECIPTTVVNIEGLRNNYGSIVSVSTNIRGLCLSCHK